MLDANSVLDQDRNFQETVQSLGLYDLHTSNPAPSTYIGSSNRRIDYMFGCRQVLSATVQTGTLSYIEGPQSDHRGLYIDLNSTTLLNHNAQENSIQPQQLRILRTGNPETVQTYITAMLR
jgi:hypothetical protein